MLGEPSMRLEAPTTESEHEVDSGAGRDLVVLDRLVVAPALSATWRAAPSTESPRQRPGPRSRDSGGGPMSRTALVRCSSCAAQACLAAHPHSHGLSTENQPLLDGRDAGLLLDALLDLRNLMSVECQRVSATHLPLGLDIDLDLCALDYSSRLGGCADIALSQRLTSFPVNVWS